MLIIIQTRVLMDFLKRLLLGFDVPVSHSAKPIDSFTYLTSDFRTRSIIRFPQLPVDQVVWFYPCPAFACFKAIERERQLKYRSPVLAKL